MFGFPLAVGSGEHGVIDMASLSVIRRWHFREILALIVQHDEQAVGHLEQSRFSAAFGRLIGSSRSGSRIWAFDGV